MEKILFKISRYRKDIGKPVQKPIKSSEYAKQLIKIGAGWNEQKTNR